MALEDELLDALAGVGLEIERRLVEAGVAVLMVILVWVFWMTPIDAAILTCIVALIYYRKSRGRDPPAPRDSVWLTVLGLVITAWGFTGLLGSFYRDPWEVGLILAGLLLIALGSMRGEEK